MIGLIVSFGMTNVLGRRTYLEIDRGFLRNPSLRRDNVGDTHACVAQVRREKASIECGATA